MARRPKPRRGVLLLIVLSLLVLFLLVGLSFMVSAGQFNRLSKTAARTDVTGMPGPKLTDAAMYQILRGTNNPYSVIQGHSLLEDLYGRDFLLGRAASSAVDLLPSGNQTHAIAVDFSNPANYTLGGPLAEDVLPDGTPNPQELHDDYYAGCVLTYLNGPARGLSTRVLEYKPQSLRRILVKGIQTASGFAPTQPSGGEALQFIINGRPFNGTGAGYRADTGRLDLQLPSEVLPDANLPIAFMPNYRSYREFAALAPFLTGLTAYNYGGLDESWDSVDYQNMFLAKAADIRKLQEAAVALEEYTSDDETDPVGQLLRYLLKTGGTTPSFHRPYLLAHLRNQLSPEVFKQVQRALVLRPIGGPGGDHPAFTGSNPEFTADLNGDGFPDGWFEGPWDVDNNGDGIPDSIWVDAGLSPVAAEDGRLYKPLVAAYIVDMDGRLNINAVESLERSKARSNPNYQNFTSTDSIVPVASLPMSVTGAENGAMGLGFGPADISLHLSPQPNLLRQRYAGKRRSGSALVEPFVPLTAGDVPPPPWEETTAPGVGQAVTSGLPTTATDDDFLQPHDKRPLNARWYAAPRMPDFYTAGPTGADQVTWLPGDQGSLETGYGSPADLHARSIPFLDPMGNMIWAGPWLGRMDGLDDPYEMNLLQPTTDDSPFDLSDLEAINRVDNPYEQSRAINMLNVGDFTANVDNFTTHSFSIPAPASVNTGRFRGTPGEGLKRSPREMFAARILRVRSASPSSPLNPVDSPIALREMAFRQAGEIMPPEFARGEKLDINQVLVPNHPALSDGERQRLINKKELFARHLFNLLMLLSEDDFGIPSLTDNNPVRRRQQHVRKLAQWAVNVVDFGDSDSVMTPLRYDINPFNEFEPFDATGAVKPNTRENTEHLRDLSARPVWGMEHPELLLTETLAFHDRRVSDTESEPDGRTVDGGDPDFDSTVMPQGSVFFELYCPRNQRPGVVGAWAHVASRAPEDLYRTQEVLDIGKRIGNKPVWRLAISEVTTEDEKTAFEAFVDGDATTFEPEDLGLELRRFVWFCPGGPLSPTSEEKNTNTYFNRTLATNPAANPEDFLVNPGDYIVVGPRPSTAVGLQKGNLNRSRQSINLALDLGGQMRSAGAQHTRVNGSVLRPLSNRVVPIIAQAVTTSGRSVGCSISEPTAGSWYYPTPSIAAAGGAPARYNPTRGTPLDSEPPVDSNNFEQAPLFEDPTLAPEDRGFPQATNTIEDIRTVFLQRLADPSRAWHPVTNPYRTIDWMPIDLTVFNSLDDGLNDPNDPSAAATLDNFASREKSGVPPNGTNLPGTPVRPGLLNIWSAWTNLTPRAVGPEGDRDGQPGTADSTALSVLTKSANTNIRHSLGWLNRSFDEVGVPHDGLDHFRPSIGTDRYSEAPAGAVDNQDGPFSTNLVTTFPTLVWNNRPYANPYELMLVPATPSSRLSAEFTVSQPNSPVRGARATRDAQYRGAFGHLLNFFHSSNGVKGEPTRQTAGNYFRLFDFVTVPSRFKGAETWLNTQPLSTQHPYFVPNTNVERATNLAKISEFREPGKVNLNTAPDSVRDQLGFDSLLKSSLTPRVPDQVDNFELTMAGYDYPRISTDGVTSADISGRYPNGLHPAEYPNPFRAGTTADLLAQMPGTPVFPAVDATLLRSIETTGITGRQPVLGNYLMPSSFPEVTGQQLAFTLQNRKTNPYFRYKDLMKLGNSVTSQSNVFAVWITVGYFEIEPNIGPNGEAFVADAAHPDGYRYGVELGSDTGKVTRHRAFYIIDRSIPVAFQNGVNHNVDKAILVRRHLE